MQDAGCRCGVRGADAECGVRDAATPASPLQKLLFGRSSGCCFSGRDVSSPGGRRDGWDSVFSDVVKNKENKRNQQQGTNSD